MVTQQLHTHATTLSEPKLIQYDPNSAVTQLVISYSVSNEFNEPEFEEYDPTPYGGGYDPTLTYGKPLPPSDEICYPRSKPNSDALSSDGVASGFIPLPKIEEEINDKAIIPSNERSNQVIEAEPDSHDSIKNGKTEDTHNGKPNQGDEFYSGYDSGRELDNGYTGEPCYEYENQVPSQIPSGYGLEAMDLCESLFGYWPCLSRMKKRGNGCQVVANEENEIAECADYLFGNLYPYFERGEDGSSYGNVLRAYQRHYPAQAQPGQLEYSQHPW
ncbi:Pro-resilin [Quillaja saponaria]|uniref:Pro-resilin n=1 Tax=Quillaja saponaria TaxID=32244 RepID=A0AAD7M2D9_QUISA|nr:Pro-resilin [Quillaja saponaria]